MIWNEPALFIAGLLVVLFAGALLPIRLEGREDHVVLTLGSYVVIALLGPRGLFLVWVAVAFAAPTILCLSFLPRRRGVGVSGATRSIAWTVVTAVALSVGYVCASLVYTGVFDREWPLLLASTSDVLVGAGVAVAGYLGTMSVRLLSQRAISRSFLTDGLDPFASPLIPFLLPTMAGFPLTTAAVAMYNQTDPWPTLMIMWWLFPIYAATALEMRRRDMAQELRRDVLAKQRLAAIGEVSARIVHQSRHQVGLMGWSIHRLRGLAGRTDPEAVSAMGIELDALAEAKDRLSTMLTSELLHERATEDHQLGQGVEHDAAGVPAGASGGGVPDAQTVAAVVAGVAEQLQAEAEREGVSLTVQTPGGNTSMVAGPQLRDVVFNLVDNAIDAAASEVVVCLVEGDQGAAGGMTITVCDDGPGLPAPDVDRAFEPFFTTKGDGTGMGLAIADALVGDLGGELLYDRNGGHTTFSVTLP